MMTKASFMMNEHLKHKVPLVQLVHPTLLVGRGRLAFPQGLEFIHEVFKGKCPADMYAHRYFIEKQADPTQPSPQYHLTEEYQGMLKVMKGLRYMSDKSCKLDTTMVAVLDEGTDDVYLYNPIALEEPAQSQFIAELAAWGVPEAVEAAKAFGDAQRVAPIQRQSSSLGSSLNLTAEAAMQADPHSAPSAYSRFRDTRPSGSEKRRVPRRRVAGIILPTRQSLWEPLGYWASVFPEAAILTSLPNPPTNEQLTTQRLTEEQMVAFKKRMQPITDVPVAHANHSNNVVSLAKLSPCGPLDLVRVLGDPVTDEFVLYHKDSATLSCTDLFHGAYSDYDPVNSWMCRVFFKFMKEGSYKRVDVAPRYKLDAVAKHGDMGKLAATIEQLCGNDYAWDFLIYAHGTPPLMESPKDALRLQWALRQQTDEERQAFEEQSRSGSEELYGEIPDKRLEDDFLLRRRRF
jgi:hypothetical protein